MAQASIVLHTQRCLNAEDVGATPCARCHDVCPAQAIVMNGQANPRIDAGSCTNCGSCIAACPMGAIEFPDSPELDILQRANDLKQQGVTTLTVACVAVAKADADVVVPCHAMWDPCLLACLAAEGVRILNLYGLEQCQGCPVRYGAQVFEQTRADYDRLNASLGVRLEIHTECGQTEKQKNKTQDEGLPSPNRRAFFRGILPSILKAAMQATSAAEDERRETTKTTTSGLPLRLRLFLRALPRLRPNFTPLPHLRGLPLGSLQADTRCTACHRCVEHCPTNALALRPFGDDWLLELQPQACVGCRRCQSLCTEGAIEILPTVSLPNLLSGRPRPLVLIPKAQADKAAAC